MSFRFSPSGREPADPWFRVGTVDVTTTVFVVAVGALTMVLDAVTARGLSDALRLVPGQVFAGEAWRLVTWPLANPFGLWTVIELFILWYFGTDLESEIGRSRMASMLTGFAVVLTTVTVLVGLVVPSGVWLMGLAMVELVVILVWIAEYPHRKFFFNIPAWVFGAVILGLQLLGFLAGRNLFGLVSLVVSLLFCAAVARRHGLLGELEWVPNLPQRQRRTRSRRAFGPRTAGRGSVVPGPWQDHPSAGNPRARDQARLDELLDKISAHGIEGLSAKERKELMELRERRSRG